MSEITTQKMISKLEVLQFRTWALVGLVEMLSNKKSPQLTRNLSQWQFDVIEFINDIPVAIGNKDNMINTLSGLNIKYPADHVLNVIDGYLLSIKAILDKLEGQNEK
ncbi:MAG TPA: hypothetical protein V6C58_11870 [Allocoleopsis sp.]